MGDPGFHLRGAVDAGTRAAAVVALYDLTPSYTVLSQRASACTQRYEHLPRDTRLWLWARLRPQLHSEDDRVAEPLVHALWEDLLDDSLEAEVWTAIVGTRWPLEERLLSRILRRSGPVAPSSSIRCTSACSTSNLAAGTGDIYAGLMDTFDWYTLRLDEAHAESILSRLSLPDENATTAYHERLGQERARRRP